MFVLALIGAAIADTKPVSVCKFELARAVSAPAADKPAAEKTEAEKKTDTGVKEGSAPNGILRRLLAEERRDSLQELRRNLALDIDSPESLKVLDKLERTLAAPDFGTLEDAENDATVTELKTSKAKTLETPTALADGEVTVSTEGQGTAESPKKPEEVTKTEDAIAGAKQDAAAKVEEIKTEAAQKVDEVKEEAAKQTAAAQAEVQKEVAAATEAAQPAYKEAFDVYEVNYDCVSEAAERPKAERKGKITCSKDTLEFKVVYHANTLDVETKLFQLEKELGSSKTIALPEQKYEFAAITGDFDFDDNENPCTLKVKFARALATLAVSIFALLL